MVKEKQHLTKEGLEQIRQIKAGMNKGRISEYREVPSPLVPSEGTRSRASTHLPSGKRFMSTACNVHSEDVKPKIDSPSIIKPYLDNTSLGRGYRTIGKVAPNLKNNGVF